MNVQHLKSLLNSFAKIMLQKKDYLIRLDSVVGDGDLGLTMSDGFWAAYKAAEAFDGDDAGKLLYASGKAMASAVPSTMGTLMASGFMNAGRALKGKTELVDSDLADLFQAFQDGVAARGKAEPGDKTFLDGMAPAVAEFRRSLQQGEKLRAAAAKAAEAAENGFRNTATMLAVHGRAATRGEASRTLLDPGAAVAKLMMQAFRLNAEEAADRLQ